MSIVLAIIVQKESKYSKVRNLFTEQHEHEDY